jgi:arsenate reductase-like glutaredoxin family protein
MKTNLYLYSEPIKPKTMYNCWNEALNYLIKKCGRVRTKSTRWVRGKQIDSYFDTYNVSNVKTEYLKDIVRLMNQYYYGIEARKELYYKLVDLGVIKEEINLVVPN